MSLKQRYFYILKFAKEPLVKIGIGTKGGNLNYERIKQHQITYGEIFDLKNSYELLAPSYFSITALERSIKDFTYAYIPPKEIMAKYIGKEGHTEIRTESSLDSILKYIELQTLQVDLKLKQGINLREHKKEVVPINLDNLKKKNSKHLAREKEQIDFPFAYKNQEHKIELALNNSYKPNLHKVNFWSFDEKNDLYLKIDANRSFLRDLYLDYNSWLCLDDENWRPSNDVDLYLHRSLWSKGISQYSVEGKYYYSIFVYSGVMIEKEQDHVIIKFSLGKMPNEDAVFEKYKKWFKTIFVNPLLENIEQKRVNSF
ncbi:MAG: hypothetical protein JNM51_06750 [Bacteroidia bacterium]|nr:hypothetical protein [Bacteroidia bacterium]